MSVLQHQLESARDELNETKHKLQLVCQALQSEKDAKQTAEEKFKHTIDVMKSDFCAQKCSISLRYLEQLQTKDQEHKAENQSLMLEKDTQDLPA